MRIISPQPQVIIKEIHCRGAAADAEWGAGSSQTIIYNYSPLSFSIPSTYLTTLGVGK